MALLLVLFRWSRVSTRYREAWAKVAVAVFRAVAAGSAIASRAVPPKPDQPFLDQPWVTTTAVAIVGYLLWEVAGAVGDHKHKLAKERTAADHQRQIDELGAAHAEELASARQAAEEANLDRDDAVFQALRLGWLLSHLRELVSEKCQRVRRVAEQYAGVRASVPQVRVGLDPDEQVHIILEWLASLLHLEAMHTVGRYAQNFRVGLFAERGGRLEPIDAFDLATRRHDPFTSYQAHAERYRLDNETDPSHAVLCLREGRTLIVADCAAEPGFEFFHDRQRNYLRSMVAYPLTGFCPDGFNPTRAAILVDTDEAGFFCEDDRERIESLLSEFAARIDLEYAISGLTG